MRVENSQFRSFWVWESDSANFNLNKRGNFRSAAFVCVGGGGEERGKGRRGERGGERFYKLMWFCELSW